MTSFVPPTLTLLLRNVLGTDQLPFVLTAFGPISLLHHKSRLGFYEFKSAQICVNVFFTLLLQSRLLFHFCPAYSYTSVSLFLFYAIISLNFDDCARKSIVQRGYKR